MEQRRSWRSPWVYWWALLLGDTLITWTTSTNAAPRCDGFVKSGRTLLTLGLGGGGAACDSVLTRRTLCVGGTGDDLRRGGFEKSRCARFALGSRGRGSSSSHVHVFARGARI